MKDSHGLEAGSFQKPWQHEENERLWRSYVRYLRLKNRSDFTILNYHKSIHRLDQTVRFTEANRLDIEEFFESELARVSVNSVRNAYRTLRAFFAWLAKEEFIKTSPVTAVEVPDEEESVPRVLSENDLRRLILACRGTSFLARRDTAIVRLMSEVGSPRLGEMYSITLDSVDWRNDAVRVTGKTGARWIPYGHKTADALERYLRTRDQQKFSGLPYLWITSQGRLGYYSFRAMLKRRCLKAGIEPISNHVLRHTSANRAMSHGISDLNMQTLYGWNSPAMVSVYARGNRTQRAIQSSRALALGDKI